MTNTHTRMTLSASLLAAALVALPAATALAQVPAGKAPAPAAAQGATPTPAAAGPEKEKPASPTMPASDAEFLAREAALQRQIRLLELEARAAELRRKLREADKDASPATALSEPIRLPPPQVQRPREDAQAMLAALPKPAPAIPRVLSVWGVQDGPMRAAVLIGGNRIEVGVGDALPDGWRVGRIGPAGVEAVRGKETRILRLGQ